MFATRSNASTHLSADMSAPKRARSFVVRAALERIPPMSEDSLDTLTLLTSELVANAIVHGRSDVELSMVFAPDACRVSVADENPRHPTVGAIDDPDALSGRGLALVEALSNAWGVEPHPLGKAVWFKISYR